MLIDTITEFEMREPGSPGRTYTPTTGSDNVMVSNLWFGPPLSIKNLGYDYY